MNHAVTQQKSRPIRLPPFDPVTVNVNGTIDLMTSLRLGTTKDTTTSFP